MSVLLPVYPVLIKPVTNRQTNSVLFFPARVNSTADRPDWDITEWNPICRKTGFSKCGNRFIPSGIPRLFRRCGPTNIARFIVSVFIGIAIKRIRTLWRITNVSRKNRSVVPFIAYFYSPASIIVEFTLIRVIAALHHACPHSIDAGSTKAMPKPLFLAPAICNPTTVQQSRSRVVKVSAIAHTLPYYGAMFSAGCNANGGESSKPLTGKAEASTGPSLFPDTPATANVAASQYSGCHEVGVSATTKTFPYNAMITPLGGWPYCRKIAELFCGNIRDVHLVISINLMLGADGVCSLSRPRLTLEV